MKSVKGRAGLVSLYVLIACAMACGGNGRVEHLSLGASASVGSAYVPVGVSSGTSANLHYRESNGFVANAISQVIGVLGVVANNTSVREDWSPDGQTYTKTTTITDNGSVEEFAPAIQLDFDYTLSREGLGGDTRGSIWHLTYPVVNTTSLRLLVGIGGGSYKFNNRERKTLSRQGNQLVAVVNEVPTTTYTYSGFPVRLEYNGAKYSAYWQAELNFAKKEDMAPEHASPVSIGLTRKFYYLFKVIGEVTVDRWRRDGITLSLGGSLGF